MTDEWANNDTEDFENYDMDSEGTTSDEVDKSKDQVDKEGWYHFEIADVVNELDTLSDNGKEKTPAIRFDMAVLETVGGQSPAGSRHYHRLYVGGRGGGPPSDGARKMALKCALRLGLLVDRDGKIVDPTTGLTKFGISLWHRAKGMQCVANIKLEKGEDGYADRYQVPFNEFFQVDDPKVASVPKNMAALELTGKGESRSGQQKPPESGTAGIDDLADL